MNPRVKFHLPRVQFRAKLPLFRGQVAASRSLVCPTRNLLLLPVLLLPLVLLPVLSLALCPVLGPLPSAPLIHWNYPMAQVTARATVHLQQRAQSSVFFRALCQALASRQLHLQVHLQLLSSVALLQEALWNPVQATLLLWNPRWKSLPRGKFPALSIVKAPLVVYLHLLRCQALRAAPPQSQVQLRVRHLAMSLVPLTVLVPAKLQAQPSVLNLVLSLSPVFLQAHSRCQ